MNDRIISTLPFRMQREIHLLLADRGLYEEDIKECFRGKLSRIADLINIQDFIDIEEYIDEEDEEEKEDETK